MANIEVICLFSWVGQRVDAFAVGCGVVDVER